MEVDITFKKYDPVNRCIYCGSTEGQLTLEHIIPAGIGGRLKLPRASCLDCNRITSGRESYFQNEAIDGFRIAISPSILSKAPHRSRVPIYIEGEDGKTTRVAIPATSAPAHLLFPVFQEPELVRGGPWDESPWILHGVVNAEATEQLRIRHGNFRGDDIKLNVTSFGLMLAKIAHAYAIAVTPPELTARMTFPLAEIIREDAAEFPKQFVGCSRHNGPYRSRMLHEIEAAYGEFHSRELLLVRLRLFAAWKTPNYLVVAGMRD